MASELKSHFQNPEARILLVEDDLTFQELVAQYLQKNNMDVFLAANAFDMEAILASQNIDLVLLDINLPGEDGLSICRRLRVCSSVPIILITARGEEVDRILGLEMGADDYLGKPFNPRELHARIKAVLRRAGTQSGFGRQKIMRFNGWSIDLAKRVLVDPFGVRVTLTSMEFDLLAAFCTHPYEILTREQLIILAQGRQTASQDRSTDVLISRLRQKIEADPRNPEIIKTVRLGGYMFTSNIEAS